MTLERHARERFGHGGETPTDMTKHALQKLGWMLWFAALTSACNSSKAPLDENKLISNPNDPNLSVTFEPNARCTPLKTQPQASCQRFRGELLELEERLAAPKTDGPTLRMAGVLSYYGLWLKRDRQLARTAFSTACQTHSDQISCVYLDALLIQEKSGSSRATAIESLIQRCVEEQPDACELLALGEIDYTEEELTYYSQALLPYCNEAKLFSHVGACLVGVTFLRQIDEVLAYPARVQILERTLARDPRVLARFIFYTQHASLEEFDTIELKGSALTHQQELLRSTALLRDLLSDYQRIIKTEAQPWSKLAHVNYVKLLHDYSKLLENAPMPEGLNSDQAARWKQQWNVENDALITNIGTEAEERSIPTLMEIFTTDAAGYWAYAKLYESWN